MWIFEAYYYDVFTNLEEKRDICFQEAICDRDAYILAKARAYDMKRERVS